MRAVLASLCFIVCAGAAAAQTPSAAPNAPPEALNQVYSCANITDDAQRLACYDQAVGRLRQAQTSGDLVAVDRHQAETINREAFGFSLPSLPHLFSRGDGQAIGAVEEVELEVARVQQRGDGSAVFTMTNGQVWQQIDNENGRNVRVGGHVRVRSASMGSFLMHVDAGGPALRVRRVS